MKTTLALLTLAVLTGCSSVRPHIPNLSSVDAGVARGGQPDAQGFKELFDAGYRRVVKLNSEREGSDQAARDLGMEVVYLPISLYRQTIGEPDIARLEAAVEAIRPGTFVHCSHGQDRTGLVVGLYRVRREHWGKREAYAEMAAHRFHPILRGLYRAWEGQP